MKLRISFVAIFCAVIGVFAQSYKVSYNQVIKIDEAQIAHLPDVMKDKLRNISKPYSLFINEEKSLFQELEAKPTNVFSENGKESRNSVIRVQKDKYDLYKSIKSNSFYIETEISGQQYNVAGKLPNISWKTTNDTDTILGYKVKKAEGVYKNKPVIVWYAEQIPVKDGPHFYRGVNGLVLKVELDKESYIATNIEKGGNEKINIPNSKDTISLEEYDKKKEEFINKLRGGATSTNGTIIKTQTINL